MKNPPYFYSFLGKALDFHRFFYPRWSPTFPEGEEDAADAAMDEGDEAPEEKDWDAAGFSAGIRRHRIEPTKNLEWWLVTGIPILSGIFSLV